MRRTCNSFDGFKCINLAQDNVWDSGMKFVNSCSKCKDSDYIIGMRPIVRLKIDALMEEYDNIEWLAYLTGFIDHERGYAELRDLVIPDNQSISSVSVDDVERNFGAVGVIHSHHIMNFGFSKIDWDYVNSNNDISIVVFNSGQDMEISMRVRTDCGDMTFIQPLYYSLTYDNSLTYDELDKDQFISDAKEKIHADGIGEFNNNYNIRYNGQLETIDDMEDFISSFYYEE